MSPVYDENTFESHIVASMLDRGWTQGDNDSYRPELALDTAQLFTFLGATQPDTFEELTTRCDGSRDKAQATFAKTLAKRIDTEGTLHVLRKGITVEGLKFALAYFKPSHTIAENALADYDANRLSVTRQLRYATRDDGQGRALDLGRSSRHPRRTAELKNPDRKERQRRQTPVHARPGPARTFRKRALVHFAVDPTWSSSPPSSRRDHGSAFNTGSEGREHRWRGQPSPAADQSGYRTACGNGLGRRQLARPAGTLRPRQARQRRRGARGTVASPASTSGTPCAVVAHTLPGAGNLFIQHSAARASPTPSPGSRTGSPSLHTPPTSPGPGAVIRVFGPAPRLTRPSSSPTAPSWTSSSDTVGDFPGRAGRVVAAGGSSRPTRRSPVHLHQTHHRRHPPDLPRPADYLKRNPPRSVAAASRSSSTRHTPPERVRP